MLYAKGKRRAKPTLHGICPVCEGEVISKCGDFKVWHWAHRSRADCDPWSEPIGPWHLSWQEIVTPERVEVPMEQHRADIIGSRGTIIELQHSSINPEEIAEREDYYSRHGEMIWLFDATERFAMKESGQRGFFSWGRTRHIEACQKPVYLDFGEVVVRVDQLLQHLDGFNGFGVWGDREWFIGQYIREVLRNPGSTGKAVPRREPESHPWSNRWPYFGAKRELTWFDPTTGRTHSTPKGIACIPVKYHNLLDESPELGNGWTAEAHKIQTGLFQNTELCIVEGLVRLVLWEPEARPRLTHGAAKLAVEAAKEHIRAGRMPIIAEAVLEGIIADAQGWERREYGERRDTRPRSDDRRQRELF